MNLKSIDLLAGDKYWYLLLRAKALFILGLLALIVNAGTSSTSLGADRKTTNKAERDCSAQLISPPQKRIRKKPFPKEDLDRILVALKESGIPLNAQSLIKNKSPEITQFIERKSGHHVTPQQIYGFVRTNIKGGWPTALKKMGVRSDKVTTATLLPLEDFEKVLSALVASGALLHATAVRENQSEDIAQFIKDETGYTLTPRQIYNFAKKNIEGGWPKALLKVGIDPKEIQRNNRLPDEDVKGVLEALRDSQVPLNAAAIRENHSLEVAAFIRRRTGYHLKPSEIYEILIRRLKGNWRSALLIMGVNADEITLLKQFPKDDFDRILIALRKSGISPNTNSVKGNRSLQIADFIQKQTGHFLTPDQIYHFAVRHLDGGWPEAIKRMGLEPIHVQKRALNLHWGQNFLPIIFALLDLGTPIRGAKISLNRSYTSAKFIQERSGYFLTPSTVYRRTIDYYPGIWPQVVRWNKLGHLGTLVHFLRKLEKLGIDLDMDSIKESREPVHCHYLINGDRIEFQIIPYQIYQRAVALLPGGWEEALLLKSKSATQISSLDRIRILVMALHHQGLKMNLESLINNKSQEIARKVEEDTGVFMTAAEIVELSRHLDRGWDQALELAGLDPAWIRQSSKRVPDELILDLLLELQKTGAPMNAGSIRLNHSREFSSIIYRKWGYSISPSALYYRIQRKGGRNAWDQGLISIGLDPDEVRLRGFAPYHLLTKVLREKRARSQEVKEALVRGGVAFQQSQNSEGSEAVVVDNFSMEEHFAKADFEKSFENLIEGLSPDENKQFQILLKASEESAQRNAGLAELIQAALELEASFTAEDYQDLIQKMGNDDSLKEAFLEVFAP